MKKAGPPIGTIIYILGTRASFTDDSGTYFLCNGGFINSSLYTEYVALKGNNILPNLYGRVLKMSNDAL